MTTRLVAKDRIWYGGLRLQPGDKFSATDSHAQLFKIMGKAVDCVEEEHDDTSPKIEDPVVAEAPARKKPKKHKRGYQRRDMRVEA